MGKYKYTEYSSKNPISTKEFIAFWEKVEKMAKETFGVDDEGDSHIQVKLVDRTRYEYLHAMPMPYPDWDNPSNLERLKERSRMASINSGVAHRGEDMVRVDLDLFIKAIEMQKTKEENDKHRATIEKPRKGEMRDSIIVESNFGRNESHK